MHQLELGITRPYENVCGFDSRSIAIDCLIKGLKVSLAANKDMLVLMDIVVVDLPDAWGMILSTKRRALIGGQLQMDLSHATILKPDGTPFVLYREPQLSRHI